MSRPTAFTFGRPLPEYDFDYFAKLVADIEDAFSRGDETASTLLYAPATLPPADALPGHIVLVRDGADYYISASIDGQWRSTGIHPNFPPTGGGGGGGGGGHPIAVFDEGVTLLTNAHSFNFVGAGVTATHSGNAVTVTIPGGGGGGSAIAVSDEGVSLTSGVTSFNFVGPGLVASNSGSAVTVTTNLATTSAAGMMAAADKTKLDGVAAGATANATDAALRDRATHTGTQAIATITGLQTALDSKLSALPHGTATVTVPANSWSHAQTVTATGVTPSSVVLCSVAPHLDADENDPELLDLVSLSALPGTDQVTITALFSEPTSGPIKVNWSAF